MILRAGTFRAVANDLDRVDVRCCRYLHDDAGLSIHVIVAVKQRQW